MCSPFIYNSLPRNVQLAERVIGVCILLYPPAKFPKEKNIKIYFFSFVFTSTIIKNYCNNSFNISCVLFKKYFVKL